MQNATFQSLPLAACVVWVDNPRKTVGDLAELTESVRSVGVLEPVLARPKGEGWEILAGQRRFLAAGLAGLTEIPALVRDVPDDVALEIALVENSARCDVLPLEEAAVIERLVRDHGRSVADVAARLGRSVRWVEKRRSLLRLTPESRAWCASVDAPLAHMESLSAVGTATQARVIERLRYVRAPKDLPPHQAFARMVAEQLHDLGTAPFDLDAELGGRGPCGTCPMRSDRQQSLFEAAPPGARCLDDACWQGKVDVIWERAKRRKLQVVDMADVGRDWNPGTLDVDYGVPFTAKAPTKDAKPVAITRGALGHVYELYARPAAGEASRGDPGDDDDSDWQTKRAAQDAEREKRRAERIEVEAKQLRRLYDLAGDPAAVVSMARMALLSDTYEHGTTDAVRLARALGLDVQPGAPETDVVRAIPDSDVLRVLLAIQVVGRLDAESDEWEPYEQTVLDLLAAPQRDPATAAAAAMDAAQAADDASQARKAKVRAEVKAQGPVRVWIAEAAWDALTLVDRADLEEPIGGATVAWSGREGFVTAEIADVEVLVALRGLAEDIGVEVHEGETEPGAEEAVAAGAEVTLRVKRSVWQQHRSGLQDSAKGVLHKAWGPEGEDRVAVCARGGDAHSKVMAYARQHGLDVRVDGGAE